MRLRVLVPVLLILVILNVALIARLSWPLLFAGTSNAPAAPPESNLGTAAPTSLTAPTAAPTSLPALPPDASVEEGLRQQGVILLSMQDGAYAHLFAYNPRFLPLTRLTNGEWDDLHPAVSPDGTRVAFTSRQSGFWDLYILDLRNGEMAQLTSTPDYDGAPTWSPDGAWLAYESYANGNMDIYLCSVTDLTQAPIRLTDDLAPDFSPDWSPAGRELVFVSSRSGEDDVWLLKLDSTTLERFTNLSHDSAAHQTHPAWSADGRSLVWSSAVDGLNTLQVWDSQNPNTFIQLAGYGVEGVWNPTGQAILARVTTHNQNGLAIYTARTGLLEMPVEILPGEVRGMDWQSGALGGAVIAAAAAGKSLAGSSPWVIV